MTEKEYQEYLKEIEWTTQGEAWKGDGKEAKDWESQGGNWKASEAPRS